MDTGQPTAKETILIVAEIERLKNRLFDLNKIVDAMVHRNPDDECCEGKPESTLDNVFDEIIGNIAECQRLTVQVIDNITYRIRNKVF